MDSTPKNEIQKKKVKKIRTSKADRANRATYYRDYRRRTAAAKLRANDTVTASKEEILALLGTISTQLAILLREQAVIKLNMAPHTLRAPHSIAAIPAASRPLPTSSVISPEEMERCRIAAIEAAAEEAAEAALDAEEEHFRKMRVAVHGPIANTIYPPHKPQNGHLREDPTAVRLIP